MSDCRCYNCFAAWYVSAHANGSVIEGEVIEDAYLKYQGIHSSIGRKQAYVVPTIPDDEMNVVDESSQNGINTQLLDFFVFKQVNGLVNNTKKNNDCRLAEDRPIKRCRQS